MTKTRTLTILAVLVLIGVGLYLLLGRGGEEPAPVATSTPEVSVEPDGTPVREVIGTSVEGQDITAYTYGSGEAHLLFIGAIHGGYEWNTVTLSQNLMTYIEEDPELIDGLTVTVIPVLNPDGLRTVFGTTSLDKLALNAPPVEETASGRFNANGVDLNRNFDCNWQPESTWRGDPVDAGTEAFSEPEAAALRDFVALIDPDAVIFYHSAANGVYGSSCNDGILPDTVTLMNTYAEAAGYPAIESFDHYEITGDAEGWLAKVGIPSVSVELTTHNDVEWEKNKAGIEGLFELYK